MRPRAQKQPQVKKEPCRELDNVDVDVSIWMSDHLGIPSVPTTDSLVSR